MREQCGFTIIELMTVILIGSILVMLAIPSYTTFVKNNCLTTDANALVAGLALARSEGAKRRDNIQIKATGGDWSTGWSVWQDVDRDGNMAAGEVLRSTTLSCSTTTITETSGTAFFIYDSTGAINAVATFDICDDRVGETGREVTVSSAGRPHTDSSFACP